MKKSLKHLVCLNLLFLASCNGIFSSDGKKLETETGGGSGTDSSAATTLNLSASNIGTLTGTAYKYEAASGVSHNLINIEMGADFSVTNICNGKSIFGLQGTALCNSIASDLLASNMYRNLATPQMSATTENTTTSYGAGYRNVPDVTKDDDGLISTVVVKAPRPGFDCGNTQATVEDRIKDCVDENGANATWSGSSKAIGGEATWKLVTKTTNNGMEIWRDERTGLLWSDIVGNDSWCRASGNAQVVGVDTTGVCDPSDPNSLGAQDSPPRSYCVEGGALTPAIGGENWSTGVYDESKGGMGEIATGNSPSVRWRLPTRNDFFQAQIDGMAFVLPTMGNTIWTATTVSNARSDAWYIFGIRGTLSDGGRDGSRTILCVGR